MGIIEFDGLDAGLDGGIHVLALDHAGGDALDGPVTGGLDRAFAVHRLAEDVDHAPDQAVTHRDRGDAPGGADAHALGDPGILAHDDDADGILLQVEGNAHHAVGELDQLLRFDIRQAGDTGDAIARLQHRTDIGNADLRFEGFDLFLQVTGNLFNEVCHFSLPANKC